MTASAFDPRRARISVASRSPEPPDRLLARLDQWLAIVAADIESEEAHAFGEVHDLRFLLVDGKPPGRQRLGELRLDLLGLLRVWQQTTTSSAYVVKIGLPTITSPVCAPCWNGADQDHHAHHRPTRQAQPRR
ncbi:MAG: hypothetical protein GEV28_28760 [Actinophytocola sp.]|uniref:hypothetical protein n=1 Tax=Actinophytocola sp. TaxID=1872138 RepID=UPI001323807E|nr:hypothetical protein [Actinophytocola sp.]MPZ84176.1 hypothetical protein [Actinophytocola sp.]